MTTGPFVTADACLDAWLCGADDQCRQIAANIRAEKALASDRLEALLNDFAQDLAGSTDPLKTWDIVCRRHKLKGTRVPAPVPAIVGRAVSLRDYAKVLSRSSGITMTAEECEEFLREVTEPGKAIQDYQARILRTALIGEFVIWATFRLSDPNSRPFDHLPQATEAICTALGLGHVGATETLVLMSYRTHDGTSTLELFRPTIGDAGNYQYYRPHPDPISWHGMTYPLPPNPRGLDPLPEVVHWQITGQTLDFPLTLVE